MSSNLSLITLPDTSLNNVLSYLDYKSTQSLRKVCRDLRYFIDDVVPCSSVMKISLRINSKFIVLKFIECGVLMEIEYRYHEKGCVVVGGGKNEKLMEGQEFARIFWNDFEEMLKHQKSALEEFTIVFMHFDAENNLQKDEEIYQVSTGFLELLKTNLSARIHPLQTKFIQINALHQNEVMSILPFIDTQRVERVTIMSAKGSTEIEFDFPEILNLEQWKNSTRSGIFKSVDLSSPSESVDQTIAGKLHLVALDGGSAVSMGSKFLNSSVFQFFEIYYNESMGGGSLTGQLKEKLGEPYKDGIHHSKRTWFFQYDGVDNVFQLCNDSSGEKVVSYKRIRPEEVPDDADTVASIKLCLGHYPAF
ncbi:hypothetical protein GCK72_020469 [Caenorhabditis remanei]|uniref:F-box domain-containing protein n=1 Tax=Caenorhabditis remanei TaxID=31234 RepID=A0A6A5GHC8_CAERE|nr:hypothetical protein GCK72_020469 [Caenorhabditis remanei]KAF1753912.1 hypothetical protein GCK72_020469 [Caenorhabditis remanei]